MGLIKTLTLNTLGLNSVPFGLIHFVTDNCNLKCSHCFIYGDFEPKEGDKRYSGDALDLASIEALTRSMNGELGVISLTGGEPFLRADLLQIARAYAINAGARVVEVSTNGWFLDKLDEFVTSFLDTTEAELYISISFDGMRETHDRCRGEAGAFDKALEAARHLVGMDRERLQVSATITVSDQETEEMEELYRFLVREVGVNGVATAALRGDPKEEGNVKFNLDCYRRLNSLIHEDTLGGALTPFTNFRGQDVINARGILLRKRVEETLTKDKYITPCTAGGAFAVIHSDGSVYPCEILDEKMGRLMDYNMDLPALMKSPRAASVRRMIKRDKCYCSFECAWTYNTIFEMRNWKDLFVEYLKLRSTSGK